MLYHLKNYDIPRPYHRQMTESVINPNDIINYLFLNEIGFISFRRNICYI